MVERRVVVADVTPSGSQRNDARASDDFPEAWADDPGFARCREADILDGESGRAGRTR